MGLETGGPISQANISLAGSGSGRDVVMEKAGGQQVRKAAWAVGARARECVWETRLNRTGYTRQTHANKNKIETRLRSGREAGQDLMWRGARCMVPQTRSNTDLDTSSRLHRTS